MSIEKRVSKAYIGVLKTIPLIYLPYAIINVPVAYTFPSTWPPMPYPGFPVRYPMYGGVCFKGMAISHEQLYD